MASVSCIENIGAEKLKEKGKEKKETKINEVWTRRCVVMAFGTFKKEVVS